MAMIKNTSCTKCGRKFYWQIERPGDSFWNRWISDDGDTLSAWFLTHNLCWEHAFTEMPEKFAKIIKTLRYEEEEKPNSAPI